MSFFNLGVANKDLLKMMSMRSFSPLITFIINEELIEEKYSRNIRFLNKYNKGNEESINTSYQESLLDNLSKKSLLTNEELEIYKKYEDMRKGSCIETCIELEYYELGKIYASNDKSQLEHFASRENISMEIKELAMVISEIN